MRFLTSRDAADGMSASSYYYLHEEYVTALLSHFQPLTPKEVTESASRKDTESQDSSGERVLNLTLGVNNTHLKAERKDGESTISGTDSVLSVASTYEQTSTPSSLAASLESLLTEYFLVEDFNKRTSQVVENWQNEVNKFALIATERYRFDGVQTLIRQAENHTEALIRLHTEILRKEQLPNSTYGLVTVKANEFSWRSRDQEHFQFEGVVRTSANFDGIEKTFGVCSVSGVGESKYLTDGARQLMAAQNALASATVLGKFQFWNDGDSPLVLLPMLIR